MMEENNYSESVCYIFYTSRGELVSTLEQYQCRYVATHTLPQWCESGNVTRDETNWLDGALSLLGYDDE